jgi:hypothetical protein
MSRTAAGVEGDLVDQDSGMRRAKAAWLVRFNPPSYFFPSGLVLVGVHHVTDLDKVHLVGKHTLQVPTAVRASGVFVKAVVSPTRTRLQARFNPLLLFRGQHPRVLVADDSDVVTIVRAKYESGRARVAIQKTLVAESGVIGIFLAQPNLLPAMRASECHL